MKKLLTQLDKVEIIFALVFLAAAILIAARLIKGASAAALDNYIAVTVSILIIIGARKDYLSGETGSIPLDYVKKKDDESTFRSLVTLKYIIGILGLIGSIVKWILDP